MPIQFLAALLVGLMLPRSWNEMLIFPTGALVAFVVTWAVLQTLVRPELRWKLSLYGFFNAAGYWVCAFSGALGAWAGTAIASYFF